MSKIPDVPSTENVPDGPLAWLKNWLDQVRLWVQTRDPRATRVGDPLDKFTDRRELVDLGILRRSSDGTFRPGAGFGGGATIVIPGGGSGGSGPDFSDLTPPPAPSGLTAEGGIFTLQLAWDAPIYTQGRGNGQTNIYGAVWMPGTTKPTLGDPRTKRIDSAMEASNLHAYPTQPATRWVVWIKFQTRNGVEGPPSMSAEATTGQDVSALLTILTGQIRESELYAALAEPIRSIVRRADDAAEDALRGALATHQETRRAGAALLAEAAARGTAITQVRTVIAQGDAQLASQITTLTAAVGDATAAIELEETARADGDEAEATQRSLLATQMRGGYTGADLAALTSGLLYSERQTRSTQTSALALRADGLEASVNTPGTGLLARAGLLEIAVAEANDDIGAVAARTTTLEARVESPSATPGDPDYNPTFAALQTEQSVRATLDGNVRALYTNRVELSAGGRTILGGYGLAGTAGGAEGPRIDFGVRANTFYVEAPDEPGQPTSRLSPFIIRTTSSTEGGVSVPAGVYMDAAYIVNLTAMYARIASLVADSISAASINVSQLVAGSLAVGAHAQSAGFVSDTSGWRISGNGVAEFSDVMVRGTIYAIAGTIGDNTIDATGIQSPNYTAGSSGFRFDSSGLLRAFASAGARVLDMAATGTAPVLKIGSALELLANGDAFFGGRLAVGTVSANVATGGGYSFPSLPNSAAFHDTGTITSATLTASGGNVSAFVKCNVKASAQSTEVEQIRILAYLHKNGVEVDSSEAFLRACVWPGPTGTTREVAADMMLAAPLEPLTGLQEYAVSLSVRFYNGSAVAISPGPSAFTSILQVGIRLNLQEIKV